MLHRRQKMISLILATSLIAPVFSACGTNPNAQPSLPTTEDTTMPTLASEENTQPTADVTNSPETSADPNTYETAPADTGVNTDFVRTADYVTPEMMNADYWISDADNRILMTDEQIKAFNHENRAVIKAGDGTVFPLFDEFEDTLDGDILISFLEENANSFLKNPTGYYLDGTRTTKLYFEDLVDRSNIDSVPEVINVRYGFSVKRMTLRMLPTEDRVFTDPYDQLFDSNL